MTLNMPFGRKATPAVHENNDYSALVNVGLIRCLFLRWIWVCGAAVATVLSKVVGVAIMLHYYFKGKSEIAYVRLT